jgi:hypothetical protein
LAGADFLGVLAFGLPVFFLEDFGGFDRVAFLAGALAPFTTSDETAARRCAVFAILPTADPTPRAMVVIRAVEFAVFFGIVSPVETLRGFGLTGDC